MSFRWIYILVSLILALVIFSRLGYALFGDAPLHAKSALPGGTATIFLGYMVAACLYLVAAGLLFAKNAVGFMCFATAVVIDMVVLDIPFAYGQLPALLVLTCGAIYAHGRSKPRTGNKVSAHVINK